MGKAIILDFGDVALKGTLNDTETARTFASVLPVTISVSSSGMDFCGKIGLSLPYEESQIGYGWRDGDINYNPHGGWFAVFYGGQNQSESYGDQVNMGSLDDDGVHVLDQLNGSRDVTIKVAE